MVAMFLSLFKVLRGLFSLILSWMSLNSLLLDNRTICIHSHIACKLFSVLRKTYTCQKSPFGEKKKPARQLVLSKAFFNRAYFSHLNSKYTSNNSKPTRSERFSVPVTSMNIFIVSKATQYLAINLPTSEQSKCAWMKWSVMLSNDDNMKQQYLNWSSFNLLAWSWYLCPFESGQLKIRRLSSADTILWEQTRSFFAQTTK